MTGRSRRKACPNPSCRFTYSRSFLGTQCNLCGACLKPAGSKRSTEPSKSPPIKVSNIVKSAPKLVKSAPKVVKITDKIQSVYGHLYNRYFVLLASSENKVHLCVQKQCRKLRINTIHGENSTQFYCKQIQMALENPPDNPMEILSENDILYKMSQIQNYPQVAKQKLDF